jgi:hypothetical protein
MFQCAPFSDFCTEHRMFVDHRLHFEAGGTANMLLKYLELLNAGGQGHVISHVSQCILSCVHLPKTDLGQKPLMTCLSMQVPQHHNPRSSKVGAQSADTTAVTTSL